MTCFAALMLVACQVDDSATIVARMWERISKATAWHVVLEGEGRLPHSSDPRLRWELHKRGKDKYRLLGTSMADEVQDIYCVVCDGRRVVVRGAWHDRDAASAALYVIQSIAKFPLGTLPLYRMFDDASEELSPPKEGKIRDREAYVIGFVITSPSVSGLRLCGTLWLDKTTLLPLQQTPSECATIRGTETLSSSPMPPSR